MINKRTITRLLTAIGALIALMAPAAAISAPTSGPNRTALVVVHGDGRMITRCVEFSEDTISGLDLLQAAGLELSADPTDPTGIAICGIDSEGCTFPIEPCFCQCQGSTCVYWSYWQATGGDDWRYSNLGSTARRLKNGDVDGWVWGEGNTAGAVSPPALSFDDICPAPTATPTATATKAPPTNTPAPQPRSSTPEPSGVGADEPAPTSTSAHVPTSVAPPLGATSAAPAVATTISSATLPPATAAGSTPTRIGTAVVTTPTSLPGPAQAPTQGPPEPSEEAASSSAPDPTTTPDFTPVPTPALVAQVAPIATDRPEGGQATSTAWLELRPTATPVPADGATAPPGTWLLLAGGITAVAAAAVSAAFVVLRRF